MTTGPMTAPDDDPAAAHAALVAALRRPGACVPGSIGEAGLIQTHLSSLLLVGQQVFKLKRPVHFGFVDFRSLRSRQALRRNAQIVARCAGCAANASA